METHETTSNGGPRADERFAAMSEDELQLANNALNEVVNGLDIPDFAARLGAEREAADALLRRVHSALTLRDEEERRGADVANDARSAADDTIEAIIELTSGDLRLIGRALDEVLAEIDVDEFQTRLGVEPKDACALAERLSETIGFPTATAGSVPTSQHGGRNA